MNLKKNKCLFKDEARTLNKSIKTELTIGIGHLPSTYGKLFQVKASDLFKCSTDTKVSSLTAVWKARDRMCSKLELEPWVKDERTILLLHFLFKRRGEKRKCS